MQRCQGLYFFQLSQNRVCIRSVFTKIIGPYEVCIFVNIGPFEETGAVTQVFFKLVQGQKKFGMKTLVAEWGTEADRNVYKKAHSAEVDAIILGSLCTREALLRRFLDWACLCEEASVPVVYSLPSSQLSMHYIWEDSSILREGSFDELFYCEV